MFARFLRRGRMQEGGGGREDCAAAILSVATTREKAGQEENIDACVLATLQTMHFRKSISRGEIPGELSCRVVGVGEN